MTPAEHAARIERNIWADGMSLAQIHNEVTLCLLVDSEVGKISQGTYTLYQDTVAELLKLWHAAKGRTP